MGSWQRGWPSRLSHVVSVGTLDASLVHPRAVFKAACLSNAAALVIAHNQPSGDPTPSGEDRGLCDRLRQAGELLGVGLLDFVIVTDPAEGFRYHSFVVQNPFRVGRHLLQSAHHGLRRRQAFQVWNEVTCAS